MKDLLYVTRYIITQIGLTVDDVQKLRENATVERTKVMVRM